MECLQDILPLLFLQHCVLIPNIDTLLLLLSPGTETTEHTIFIFLILWVCSYSSSAQVMTMIHMMLRWSINLNFPLVILDIFFFHEYSLNAEKVDC